MKVRFMRSPEPGDGGAVLPPTLDEIMKGAAATPPATPPAPAAPPAPAEPKPGEPPVPAPAEPETPPEPEKDPEEDETGGEEGPSGEDQEDVSEEFYRIVENATGIQLEVTYPEDVSRLSPQGVAIREQALWNAALKHVDSKLKEEHPRGYAFYRHLQAGGREEDFFDSGRHSYKLPTAEEIAASADTQAAVFRQDLMSKGLDADSVEALVQKAIKENKLLEKAQAAHGTISAAQQKALADIENNARQAEQNRITAVTNMTGTVKETIDNFPITVPKADRQSFETYVMDHMEYDEANNTFYFVQPVGDKEINLQLQALFYQFKKGDLKALVEKRVETKAAQALRLRLDKSQTGAVKTGEEENVTKKPLTLGEIKV